MRKHQKYNKEEMYLAIELWKASGLTQIKFCAHEKLSVNTFGYWLRKYKKEKSHPADSVSEMPQKFIPVKVTQLNNSHIIGDGRIEVSFPNGVQLNCPAGIDIQQLKTLINF
ncbi:MAG TPA: hypothetical protein VLA03_00720 [Draconibacterium sp.]|nr:hypothetical protein [Draconibacterium sp.]